MTAMPTQPETPAVPATRIAEIERRALALVAAHVAYDAYNANQGDEVLATLSDAESDFNDYVTDHFRDVAALCALARGASQDAARLQWIADHEDGTYNKSFRAAMEEEPGDGYFGATDPDFHTLTAPISHIIDNCMAAEVARCAARSSQGGTE